MILLGAFGDFERLPRPGSSPSLRQPTPASGSCRQPIPYTTVSQKPSTFGWPSGVCCGHAALSASAPVASLVIAAKTKNPVTSNFEFNRMVAPSRVIRFQIEAVAFIFQKLEILFHVAIEDHVHIPGPREYLGIFNRHRIVDVVGIQQAVALHHVHI